MDNTIERHKLSTLRKERKRVVDSALVTTHLLASLRSSASSVDSNKVKGWDRIGLMASLRTSASSVD